MTFFEIFLNNIIYCPITVIIGINMQSHFNIEMYIKISTIFQLVVYIEFIFVNGHTMVTSVVFMLLLWSTAVRHINGDVHKIGEIYY